MKIDISWKLGRVAVTATWTAEEGIGRFGVKSWLSVLARSTEEERADPDSFLPVPLGSFDLDVSNLRLNADVLSFYEDEAIWQVTIRRTGGRFQIEDERGRLLVDLPCDFSGNEEVVLLLDGNSEAHLCY